MIRSITRASSIQIFSSQCTNCPFNFHIIGKLNLSSCFDFNSWKARVDSQRTLKMVANSNLPEISYPKVHRDENFSEILHGQEVFDPYRWLEDPDSDKTKKFVEEQNSFSAPFMESPFRKPLKEKLESLWNYAKYSCPYKRGSRYYYFMNTGLQNQSVMYVQESLDSEPRVFLDPNELSEDGTVALSTSAFSEDGEIFAYGLSKSGSDWISIHFKKVSTLEDFPEVLHKVKFSSISWTHDNLGIFYGYYPSQDGKTDGSETTSNENQKLYYHKIGTSQEEDVLVVEFPEHPKWRISSEVSDCGKYLILTPIQDCRDNLLYFSRIPSTIDGLLPLSCVVDKFEADFEYVTNNGSVCVFRTNKGAPNYHLVQIDLENPHPDKWVVLVKEHPKNVLDWAACVNEDKLVLCYISDVKNVLQVHSLSNGHLIINLPLDIGTISGYSGKRKQNEIFYQFTSFLSPSSIFHLDFTSSDFQPKIFRETKIEGFEPSDYQMQQIFYTSKDGTKVPMFIVHQKDVVKDGTNPTLLYGYGGFNISIQPYFSISRVLYMKSFKGVIAIPNIRGGGEYGEYWHNSGRLLKKQNGFNDFQSAAEYLIKEKYTTNKRLIIQGGSNGGLLVGACINQRPDLFGVAISQVGVLDLLRFHKFTIGYAWCSDYGNPEEKEHFENLLTLSPLHNIRVPSESGVQYPATLLLTADHDDRVVPLHSFKFISELQHRIGSLSQQKLPLAIRIDTKAGHGSGKPTAKVIEEHIDIYCFIINTLRLDVDI